MDKYLKYTKYNNGDIISLLVIDLYNTYNYNDILFVRTPTTGEWLDKLLINNNNITRILYNTNIIQKYTFHKSTTIIDSIYLENKLNYLNKKFDLICIDPFHEYTYSKRDLFFLSSLLTEKGILICHDCFPPNKDMASPKFKTGSWCGETYVAFVEFAYNNPNLFYGILNIDTGIGIISKIQLELLTNNFDIYKQKQLLTLHENSNDTYTYFCENSKDIINIF
jgi:hypothetical protein